MNHPLVCENCHHATQHLAACPCGCPQYLCGDCDERIRFWFDDAWRRWQT